MSKKIIDGLAISFLMFLIYSCNEKDTTHEKERDLLLTVASSRTEKNNMEETPGYAFTYFVKEESSKEWETFPYEIIDFNYEEGYEYIIKIKEVEVQNPPKDHPSFLYYFIELVDKKEKDSDNLPLL